MMRKIHRAALAARLKPLLAGLAPAFQPVSPELAKALGAERRFAFYAEYPAGKAFLLYYPAATATDNYFTVELAWLAAQAPSAPLPQSATLSPWRDFTRDQMASRPAWRLRLDDLRDALPPDSGAFEFSTAASRYCAALFSLDANANQKAMEAEASALFQACHAEESALTDEQAALELAPAINRCHQAILAAALPIFKQASDGQQSPPAA